jgi:hypothetical protein
LRNTIAAEAFSSESGLVLRKEENMRKLLFAAAAIGALATAAPASAQVYFDADRGGVEFGVGPRHEWRDRDEWRERGWRAYDYARECRVTRERIVTPSGRVIYRTRRDCD